MTEYYIKEKVVKQEEGDSEENFVFRGLAKKCRKF